MQPRRSPDDALTPMSAGSGLLKENVASALREAIMSGTLLPGQRVVEGKWAREFGVAQASVREAINLLLADGFLTKDSGRSARVIRFTPENVKAIYEVRSALEGLAAGLVARQKADLAPLERAVDAMEKAIGARNMTSLIEADLDFHLKLCELSGNTFLLDSARRVLSPLFAFVLVRVLNSGQGPDAWKTDLPRHRRFIDIIHEGDPAVAEQYVQHSIRRFATSAYEVWENVGGAVEAHGAGRRTGKRRKPQQETIHA